MSEEKKTWLDRIGLIHLWATIKAALDTKVDKIPGFNLSENNYSTEDKTKLDGLSNYEHPTTPGNKHIPAGGIKNQVLRWKEDGTAQWDNETSPPEYKVMTPASEESAGDSGLVPSPPVGAQNKFLRGDGTWAENENTWRPVQDNLDTDSAEDSLSAAQGKVLKGLVDGKSDKGHQHVLSDIPDLKDAATKMTRTATDITDSKFESAEADSKYVPDMAMLSNWNGAYNENGESNLQYCDQGRFGSMAKRTDTDFLELAGGTMTGALNFANNTWNLVGDDAYIGDHNVGGGVCIVGANDATRLVLCNKDDQSDFAHMRYAGGDIIDFNKTLGANITGNANTANYLRTRGNANPQTGRNQNYGNVYTYNTKSGNSGSPTTYTSTIGFGNGTDGTVEICGEWTGGRGLWARALRDCEDNWFDWQRIYTDNYNNAIFQTSDPGSGSGLTTGRILFVYE